VTSALAFGRGGSHHAAVSPAPRFRSLVPAALLAVLPVAGPAAARAADVCSLAGVVCVPEESTLDNAFRTVPDGGTIDIASNTYFSPDAQGFRLGSNKDRSFTVRARDGAGTVTLSGNGAFPVVVLDQMPAGRWITFENLRFVSGRTTTANFAGGVTLKNARATFADCDFLNNRAASGSNGGGGLGLFGGARAIVVRGRFDGNRSLPDGAAIFAQKGFAPYNSPSELWVLGTTFHDNCETDNLADCTSGHGAGGAILVRNSTAYVADSLFDGNVAGYVGGAIYSYGDYAASSPYCPNPTSDMLVVRSRFVGNRAAGAAARTEAGAVFVENCGRVRIYRSILENNSADWGGAIESYRGRVEVYDSLLRGNRATGTGANTPLGGAILLLSADGASDPDYPAASLRLERSLVRGSSSAAQEAQYGGCLAAQGDATHAGSGPCQSGQVNRCAQVTVTASAFFDCTVARTSNAAYVNGGGFVLDRAYATLTDVLVARNHAAGNGGGVCANGGAGMISHDSTVSLTDLVFSGNTSDCQSDDLFVTLANPPTQSNVRFYSATSGSPADGKLLGLPPGIAADTALTQGESWLAYGWSGGAATLDGSSLGSNPKNGVAAAGASSHTLEVNSGAFTDSVTVQQLADARTSLLPSAVCPPSGTTTLSWTTPSGSLLAAIVDQNVGGSTASGSAPVTPPGTVDFRRVAMTDRGGAISRVRVFVAECPSLIFVDGFERGDATAWSAFFP
jgi:hypothetical protein